MQSSARFENATFRCEDISFNRALDRHRFHSHLTMNAPALAHNQRASGVDLAVHFAIDLEFVAKAQITFDRHFAGKKTSSRRRSWRIGVSFSSGWRQFR